MKLFNKDFNNCSSNHIWHPANLALSPFCLREYFLHKSSNRNMSLYARVRRTFTELGSNVAYNLSFVSWC